MNNAYLARAKKVITDPEILSVVAAKRAKQLALGGARPMIKCDSDNVVDVALLEIAEGLLCYEFGQPGEKPEVQTETPAEAAATPTEA
ncbi:MAG: DNA-directed RNA polymerase subunit omega [Victivallaceae bacterium]|nr:DNA-directed RNA polymerase subunit omega [Victivallaceae bacterium]